jgi:hypothetical protein
MKKLTWAEVGMANEPGRYETRYGLIEVTADDLWVWSKYPNAAFVVMQPSPFSEETVSRLGTFELGEDCDALGMIIEAGL